MLMVDLPENGVQNQAEAAWPRLKRPSFASLVALPDHACGPVLV